MTRKTVFIYNIINNAVSRRNEKAGFIMYYIGVDLGGTNIAVGIVNEQFEIVKKGSTPTKPERGNDPIIEDMAALAKKLIAEGKRPTVILGFNTAEEVFFTEEFAAIGCKVLVATADGSVGIKGFVTDAMDTEYTYFYTCGPEPMLKAIYGKATTSGQLSFEERMGCGFGACMGCSCKTKYGNKRICRDGPVLVKEEIIW